MSVGLCAFNDMTGDEGLKRNDTLNEVRGPSLRGPESTFEYHIW